MAAQASGTDHEQSSVTRRALLAAAGAVGLAATVSQNAVADDKGKVERRFKGESADGQLQTALEKALEGLDEALNEGGVRDATATWKVAEISGERGTFKEGRTVKVSIIAARSPQWDK